MIWPASGDYTDCFISSQLSNPRLRTLADADNRGKLNLAEFHVAMGLIYRSTSFASHHPPLMPLTQHQN